MKSMMGFYPDCKANMNYQLFKPVFDKVEIQLNKEFYTGETIIIESKKEKSGKTEFSFNQKKLKIELLLTINELMVEN